MSRIAGLLLLLLVCCRSPSNADLIHALNAAQHPVVPVTTDAILRVAEAAARKPENKFVDASSGVDHDGRKSDSTADDVDRAAARPEFSNDEYDASKRKWEKVGLHAWEKRRWNAANSKAAWGKRDEADETARQDWIRKEMSDWNQRRDEAADGKRRWSANNGMRAWGKRSESYVDGRSRRSVADYDQRRWTPVKRQWRHTAGPRYGGPKRTWEFNTMKTWGKRNDHVDGSDWPKRSWSSDNSLRVWG